MLKKNPLLFLLLIISCLEVSAQYTSYQDQYNQVKMGFDLPMSMNENTFMFISALAEYEMQMHYGLDSERLAEMKEKSFASANCANCKLLKKMRTEQALSYIFEVIEEGDVFYIKQEEEGYYLEHYRGENP